jgi:serpin B
MPNLHQTLGLAAVAVLAAAVACAAPQRPDPVPQSETPGVDTPDSPNQDVRAAADGSVAFAADLYAQLRDEKGNLIASPYSVSTALAMTAAGADGTTFEQMQKVLRLPAKEKLGPAYGGLAAAVTAPPKVASVKPELTTANAVWAQQGYSWKKEFLQTASTGFRAKVENLDFRADPEAARGRINEWVAGETKDRIKDLVPPGAVMPDTKMVLTNAVYFKARWLDTFNKNATMPEDFTRTDGTVVKAPLMHQQGRFELTESDDLQAIRLPYDGGTVATYVLLPRKADGLPALEKALTAETLAKWTKAGAPAETTRVWLPKFKFTKPTELGPTLVKMGMTEPFDAAKANFRGMTDNPEGLFISRVIHKAFVEVDEEGTEAAAATSVVLAPGARLANPPLPKTFKADHPFLFVIKHEATGTILFLGRVEDPTRSE